ncbi:MAG: hypothetical protein JWO57_921 [Pseudonocardiales bacterium]|nr:hypothetical protein [Pseudonocardiales bacterium]
MPAARSDDPARRSVVPEAAGRSLWLAAMWTGVGAAIVCATLAIVAVAICWLPVSGASGHSISAIRAGLLTFLAATHGGITVDGVSAQFVPLGLTVIVGMTAWRAGCGLADAAGSLDETDPARLAMAAGVQAASFTVACLVAVPFATLGTSSAPFVGVGIAAATLFAVTGGTAFARSSGLAPWIAGRLPPAAASAPRLAAAGLLVYLVMSAVLVCGSLAVHGARVEALSREVGGGWGGVPVLLLGLLSAPNALIGGASYLAGPGFAVGAGTTVSPFSTAHGVVPAFPILGALPQGHGATPLVWCLVVATPLVAGLCVARLAARADGWPDRLKAVGAAASLAAVVMALLAWQGGGAIGSGRLHTIGASPWFVGLVIAGELGAVATAALVLVAAGGWVRGVASTPSSDGGDDRVDARPFVVVAAGRTDDKPDQAGKLAG